MLINKSDFITEELLDIIVKHGYPYKTIPVDYCTLSDGGGYVEYGIEIPKYSEVLDWISSLGYDIIFDKSISYEAFKGLILLAFEIIKK